MTNTSRGLKTAVDTSCLGPIWRSSFEEFADQRNFVNGDQATAQACSNSIFRRASWRTTGVWMWSRFAIFFAISLASSNLVTRKRNTSVPM